MTIDWTKIIIDVKQVLINAEKERLETAEKEAKSGV